MGKTTFNLSEQFGSNVFNDRVMKERLPKETYKALRETIDKGKPMSREVANVVANAMKDWSVERGATHYTHWFQPLTGLTAEKHDAFINPTKDGGVILEFSGEALIKGEPDASSFPSGGLRATFEARGYTAWDCTSPAFLKEDGDGNVTLVIPTAFCSYTSEALDKKTPLLRSMEVVSKQALRVLRALGNKHSTKVSATVGPEQEYFLVDKKYYDKRLDLITCGRTLFGAAAPKGQELEDQYFGAIKDRAASFMRDFEIELWKMGVTSKTKHNEVAPAQYETAPIFQTANIATDHNQLVMETMQKVALRHGLVCLLHEKPYAGINGSGKHNNWSLATDDGINLLDPGHTAQENERFLLFVSALIKAVDRHADMLRASTATPGNDHRLGANEAPPAIISIFLGTALTEVVMNIAKGKKPQFQDFGHIKIGVDTLPDLPRDNSDRNRTSPFAFTGNKFEFRMVPSSASIAGPNVVLNVIAAEALDEIATRLEKAKDKNKEAEAIIKEAVNKHGRVIFNGNNYSPEWEKEAMKRGLPNIKNMVDALESFVTKKSYDLFAKYNVLSHQEVHSRFEIYLEQYAKRINIEAQTGIQMVKRQYLPAVIRYTSELAGAINHVEKAEGSSKVQKRLLAGITKLLESASAKLDKVESCLDEAQSEGDVKKKAALYRDEVLPSLTLLRKDIDALEQLIPACCWPVPTYAQMLFDL